MTTIETNWFRDRLADKRLSQRKLARHLRLDPAAVSLMIRGKRRMSASEAAEIARLLGVSVDEVVLRAGCVPTIPDAPLAVRQPAGPAATPPAGLEVPVPLAGGEMALIRVPNKLNLRDAERISAIVRALAVPD